MDSPYPVVQIHWSDACSEETWAEFDDKMLDLVDCVTCGYLVYEDKRRIVVAASLSEDKGYSDAIAIPIGWITKRKVIKDI